jgi:hypothetical protein
LPPLHFNRTPRNTTTAKGAGQSRIEHDNIQELLGVPMLSGNSCNVHTATVNALPQLRAEINGVRPACQVAARVQAGQGNCKRTQTVCW